MPGPSPRNHADPATENARCVQCHTSIASEWQGSLHRAAFEDPSFTRALGHEDTAFCRGCHAPEADASQPPPKELAAIGVACVTCHVPRGSKTILAGPSESGTKAPHPITRSADFATGAACRNCHEFDFPDGRARLRPERMQLTMTEHEDAKKAGFALPSCNACHMPSVAGARPHKSHAFPASRSPAVLQQAVRISARRSGDAIEIVLRRGDVAHAFPTGDLFRRLVVSARLDGERDQVRYLARHFVERQERPGVLVRVAGSDDRPFVNGETERVVRFDLGPSATEKRATYRVVYQRVGEVMPGMDARANVEDAIELASGTLDGAQ